MLWSRKVNLVQINGGLGNQMFQYAYYRYLKQFDNIFNMTMLDLSAIVNYNRHNGWELHKVFNCDINALDNNKIETIKSQTGFLRNFKILYEPKETFFQLPKYKGSKKYRFHYGYWQNEGYIKPIADRVKSDFKFDSTKLSLENRRIEEQILSGQSVAIHIRRGDYVSLPAAAALHGGLCTLDYYKRAIAYVQDHLRETINFYLFSDDTEWVEENFNLPNQTIISHNFGENSWQDMYLISKCKHQIIANSSFSWWGAWLNNNPEKIVIAPKRWLNNHIETDIVPTNWIKL